MSAPHVISIVPVPTLRRQAPVAVRCVACGALTEARPDATSLLKRGDFGLVAEWRRCSCGAFMRSARVARMPAPEPYARATAPEADAAGAVGIDADAPLAPRER
ncbi:MAG: hypothetical protein NVS1B2_00910 [Vulcanimicrobiaceae bacterium]